MVTVPAIRFFNPLSAVLMSVTRHVQHHFYAFHDTAVYTHYWLCYWHYSTMWGAAEGIVFNRKGVWQLGLNLHMAHHQLFD